MYFSTASLLVGFSALIASTSAIQTIYIGIKDADCDSGTVKGGQYDLWFSDSNVCNDGLVTGYPRFGTSLCEESYTILGHSLITFTGCSQPNMTSLGLPTGVSDDGAPALTCVPVEDPEVVSCPSSCGFPDNPFSVTELLYCS